MKALKVRHILAQGKQFLSVALGFEEDIDQAQLDRRLKKGGSMRHNYDIVFIPEINLSGAKTEYLFNFIRNFETILLPHSLII